MRLIIAGSRHFSEGVADRLVTAAMNRIGFMPTVTISGAARGIDQAGERWAIARGVPVERHPADWNAHGRAAGPIRNREMAEVADAALVIWDGSSKGSKNMLATAKKLGLRVFEVVVLESFGKAAFFAHPSPETAKPEAQL